MISQLLNCPKKKEQTQIISQNQADEAEPKEAKFLSDKSTTTLKESIKRGTQYSNSPQQSEMQPQIVRQQSAPPPEPVQNEINKKLTFKLSPDATLSSLNKSEEKSKELKNQNLQAKVLNSPGEFGSQDYLPSIADGDVTLMNAKASKYAVFVRRVALQVFSFVKTSGLTGVTAAEISEAQKPVRYRAKLSPKGELLTIEKEDASGNGRFDEIVYSGVKRGAHDPNPPDEAKASDGNYYFIFETQVWVKIEQDRGGFPRERRFILLRTGLE